MRENLIELAYCLVMALLILGMIVTIQHFTLKSKEPIERDTNEDVITIKGHPTDYTEDEVYAEHRETLADPPVLQAVEVWIANDTPQDDIDADNFEMLVACCFAESGNQSQKGQRLVVDVIGNRAGWDMSKVDDVITAKGQFESYPNGMNKWRSSITEDFIQLVADEWNRADKACGNVNLWYFRTNHYSPYGKPWMQVQDHYFSIK